MAGHVLEDTDTLSETSGGSSDNEANDWMDSPTGRPSCRAAMITIPDAKWPSVARKSGVLYAEFTEPVNGFCICKSNFDLTKELGFCWHGSSVTSGPSGWRQMPSTTRPLITHRPSVRVTSSV